MKEPGTYRWANPHEWLHERIQRAGDDPGELRGLLMSIVQLLESDDIYDTFQGEMTADGYFDDLDAAEEDEGDEDDTAV